MHARLKLTIAIMCGCFFWQSAGFAQQAPALASEEVAPKTTVTAPTEPIYALAVDRPKGSSSIDDFCFFRGNRSLPSGAMLVVVRKFSCTSRYGSNFNKDYVEALYNGKKINLLPDNVVMKAESEMRLAQMTSESIEVSMVQWQEASKDATRMQEQAVLEALEKTAKHGLAILRASIYDVSEHTEGTGFKVNVYNSGRKTIKYVTFSVVGLNAVGDPVRDRIRQGSVQTLRGIGPIEPDKTASYTKEYMWMTDIVEKFKITSIRLEFMDGSSKSLNDAKAIWLTEQHYEILTSDND